MDHVFEGRIKKAKKLEKYIELCEKAFGEEWREKEANLQLVQLTETEKKIATAISGDLSEREAGKVPEGTKILLLGEICQSGMDYLARFFAREMEGRFARSFIELGKISQIETEKQITMENLQKMSNPIYFVGEGGLYRSLNEMSADIDSGFVVDYHKIPVSQVAIEFCEYYDMDPWRLYSGNGCFLLLDQRGETKTLLREMGISFSLIGRVTKEKKKVIRHNGVESLLNRARSDELLELLKSRVMTEEN